MPIILTETERATAIEIAKAITNEHLNAVLEILRGRQTSDEFGNAAMDQMNLATTPIIEFVTGTYNRAFDAAVDQLMHARL